MTGLDPVILWFRRDLRLSDQAALAAAAGEGAVIPVYILDDDAPGDHAIGGAARWWLHHSLTSLDRSLRAKGSRLILRRGDAANEIAKLAKEIGATRAHALHHYEPWWREAEAAVAKTLDLALHDGNYLSPPGSVTTGAGDPYKIYTPFWKALNDRMPPPEPIAAPDVIPAPSSWPHSDELSDWGLLPTDPDWAKRFAEDWAPGEEAAKQRVADFIDEAADYDEARNLPAVEGSSRLSPHLHWGEVSPATVWDRIAAAGRQKTGVNTFLKELAWRDYAQNVILQFGDYATKNARARFDALQWRSGKAADDDFAAWTKGRTGYPIVDAGMRQLWASGWMHNRVRMIAASFLVKHLLIDWRHGERWFWDTLVDADYGNNSVNWQWIAGTGIDSNMFVRIMAPLSQSEKFDAGDYIRQWVLELAALDDAVIHDPHDTGCAPPDYPAKLIEHRAGRERALAAYARRKAAS